MSVAIAKLLSCVFSHPQMMMMMMLIQNSRDSSLVLWVTMIKVKSFSCLVKFYCSCDSYEEDKANIIFWLANPKMSHTTTYQFCFCPILYILLIKTFYFIFHIIPSFYFYSFSTVLRFSQPRNSVFSLVFFLNQGTYFIFLFFSHDSFIYFYLSLSLSILFIFFTLLLFSLLLFFQQSVIFFLNVTCFTFYIRNSTRSLRVVT